MNYSVLFLILIGSVMLLSVNYIHAMPPFTSQEVYDFSDVIIIGKVLSVNSTFSPTHNLYEIKVEKFLKNQQNSDIVFAAGQKTVNSHLGNSIFSVNERGLFFLTNYTMNYDGHSGIFGIYPTSRLIDLEWDNCGVFEKEISREHWTFGGIGQIPTIRQGNNTDIENFLIDKEITITYDIFNHSSNPKNATYGMLIKNLDDPNLVYDTTEINSGYLLEPCTIYKTLTWNFTPSKPGHYNLEFYDLKGFKIELGFIVLDVENTKLHDANNVIPENRVIDYQALEASNARCTVFEAYGKESCNLQSSLILGITTTAIIGTVIAISMIMLRKRK